MEMIEQIEQMKEKISTGRELTPVEMVDLLKICRYLRSTGMSDEQADRLLGIDPRKSLIVP